MIATVISAVVGALVAVGLSLGGVSALQPAVKSQVPPTQMVKYGDNGHF